MYIANHSNVLMQHRGSSGRTPFHTNLVTRGPGGQTTRLRLLRRTAWRRLAIDEAVIVLADEVPRPNWMDLARELGGVIGRSSKPICFILGAGCSLSSGAPTTSTVDNAFREATATRFRELELRKAIHVIPEDEKQDILRPLFARVTYGPGYLAISALGRYRTVLALNLNWDKALANSCARNGIDHVSFDLNEDFRKWPSIDGPGVYDIHVHGIIGQECRYGHLETLNFSEGQERWLIERGLVNTTVILGASLVDETDFSHLFLHRAGLTSSVRPPSSQWFFLRGNQDESGVDKLRQINAQIQPFTYECASDIDFDIATTIAIDRALALIPQANQ